ncbi:MAG: hypothetical protein QM630_06325 [Microbacterium sp.]
MNAEAPTQRVDGVALLVGAYKFSDLGLGEPPSSGLERLRVSIPP